MTKLRLYASIKKMRIHLISAPSTPPNFTPLQIGCLKAYIDKRFNNKIETLTYSAHLSVPLRAFHVHFFEKTLLYKGNSELLWFILVLKRFSPLNKNKTAPVLNTLIKRIAQVCKTKDAGEVIKKFEKAMAGFIEEELVPKLSKKELNLIGFTLTSEQLYASLFCYLYLLKYHPRHRMMFVFGGTMTSFPSTLNILKKFKVEGLAVLGEGEQKLEHIAMVCRENEGSSVALIIKECSKSINGVCSIEGLTNKEVLDIGPSSELELASIENLPLPDYTEYFDVLRSFLVDEEVYINIKDTVVLLMDGSRGCAYAKCDFCGLNSSWCSYRRKSAKRIYGLLTAALVKHRPAEIFFSDNLCDPWVDEFCGLLIKNNVLAHSITMELRATHDESFYAKLSLAGFSRAQLGIEALSDSILQKMKKGTTLIHNVQSMKYLKELKLETLGNIITRYPGSTVNDVKNTQDTVKLLPHLDKLELVPFVLMEHSPIYNGLKQVEKEGLKKRNVIKMPSEVFDLFADDLLLPSSRDLSAKIKRAWVDFQKWYDAWDTKDLYLNVYRVSADRILIKDNRFGKVEEYLYSGDAERLYTLCHKGQTVEQLSKESGIKASNIQKILNSFVKKKLMISSNDRYLSIALRPKEELISNSVFGSC